LSDFKVKPRQVRADYERKEKKNDKMKKKRGTLKK